MEERSAGERIDMMGAPWGTGVRGGPVGASGTSALSYVQESLWLCHRMHPHDQNNITAVFRLHGRLDAAALRRALDRIISRHQILRTVFAPSNDVSSPSLLPPETRFPLQEEHTDCGGIERVAMEEIRKPFPPEQPPVRGHLLQISEREHVLLITHHALVCDVGSMHIFASELSALYGAFAMGRDDALHALNMQYSDYAQWQRQQITPGTLKKQLQFWTRELASAPAPLQFYVDPCQAIPEGSARDRLHLKLSNALTKRLRQLARQHHVSLFATALEAWAVLLGRWCGQDELIVGTRVTNQHRQEFASLIGPFENVVALRIDLKGEPAAEQLLRQIHSTIENARAHQDVPFDRVVSATGLRDHRPPIQVQITLADASRTLAATHFSQMKVSQARLDGAGVNDAFSLSVQLTDGPDGLTATLDYDRACFTPGTIEQVAASWQILLHSIAKHPRRCIGRLGMLNSVQREAALHSFNQGATRPVPPRLIHELVEEQVRHAPDAIALIYHGQPLTYGELNVRANQLAWHLRESGVGPDQLVGICIERSTAMIVGLLAILKAGGAYVPLDPAYPPERLAYMIQDAAPSIVLTQKQLRTKLPETAANVIEIDGEWAEAAEHRTTNLTPAELGLTGRHLAYVIYTSGSTGTPKGAMNEHRGMVNRILAHEQIERFTASDVCCQRTSISFVDAVFEIFGALATGQRLVIVPGESASNGEAIAELIANHHATRLTTVPSLARGMLESPTIIRNLASLRSWTLSGEEVQQDLLASLQQELPGCEFIVQFGSSEVSSDATIFVSRKYEGGRVPLGRPLPNVYVYVLDRNGEPVPTGVVGEIHVGGAGVGRGYINRPELTTERFIRDRFKEDPDARLYRMGDLGRWRPDGMLEYAGRADHQVKIRGFRIELAEIEAHLLRQLQVREAAVVVREDVLGDKRLIAYVTLRNGSECASADLRAQLQAALPEFMVPAAFVVMPAMPLTPSGKLDRRSLPPPPMDAFVTRPFEPPQGDIEQALARAWEQTLRLERVGRRDNFFELGGHSLHTIQMIESLRRVGLAAHVASVFEHPTLADLAQAVTSVQSGETHTIETSADSLAPDDINRIAQQIPGGASNIQDICPLAPLQEGLLFHHLLHKHREDAYVEATLLKVSTRERLDELIAALQGAIDRHDILRTALLWERLPHPVQVVHRTAVLPVDNVVLDRSRSIEDQLEEWMRPERQQMSLMRAPLMRLQVAADPLAQEWHARLQLHHIVSDDVSLRILISEIVAHLEGRADTLPAPAPYRNHVMRALACARAQDTEIFFREKLSDVSEPTALFELSGQHADATTIREARRDLDWALAKRVRLVARRMGVSVATLFHAAWSLVAARASGRDDVVFGTVLLGRSQGDADEARAVGMFINTLPLRIRLRGVSVKRLIEQTQAELAALLAHDQASLPLAQRCSAVVGSTPLFNAVLNYRHGAADLATEWAEAKGIRVVAHWERTSYPIMLSVNDDGQTFSLTAQSDERVDPARIADFSVTAMSSLVEALEKAPEAIAQGLSVLPDYEQHQLIRQFNDTKTPLPEEQLVHQLFERQAQDSPGATAVEHNGRRLTFAELNSLANGLAHYLRSEGVGPNQVVGLCLERSIEMVVALLGIMKAGGAYLPLDPAYPPERLAHMLTDAAPRILLTQDRLREKLPRERTDAVALETLLADLEKWPDHSLVPAELGSTTRDLVYVIYTSGSTGRPKGTTMEHSSMVNLMEWHRSTFGVSTRHRVLQFAAISFDVAFQEIFSTLCTGSTLVLLDEWVRTDARALAQYLVRHSITRLFLPPLMLQALADYTNRAGVILESLTDVITAGEQLRITPEVCAFFEGVPECKLHNHYGPTETHVVTALTLSDAPTRWPQLPTIGRPISNCQIYVLDERRQPVPLGSTGEIYIGGAGVARGYLGQVELTAQRFIPDPFSAETQARLYKSGDLGRWRADGTIEYLGRNDQQVKIRGFRIELGEIELQLRRHEKVREAAVIAREDIQGDKQLVAYVILASGENVQPAANDLREHLMSALPQYMVPSSFVVLDRFPITPNGKLDRRALPAPEYDPAADRQYEAPQGQLELQLADIWQSLLHIQRIGRHDNFFELGAHSLLAMQAVARIEALTLMEIPMRLLFEHPTLEQLSSRIEDQRRARPVHEVAHRVDDLHHLLEQVATMSESEVKKLMNELRQQSHG